MKKIIYLTLLLLLSASLHAQTCTEYNNLIRDGDRCLKDKKFSGALNNYLTALKYCESKINDVQKKLQKLFDEITQLQKKSDQNAKDAFIAKNIADSLLIVENRKSALLDSIRQEETLKSNLNAVMADSIIKLTNRFVLVRDSMQKERVKDLELYSKMVDSILRNRKNLEAIVTNLKQIIEKETKTSTQQEKESEAILTTNVNYNGIHTPSVTFEKFSIINHFLAGQGTNYMLTQNASDRKNYEIKALIIHVTDGPKIATLKWFFNPNSKVSDHIVIGQDGSVTQTVPFNFAAWHAGRVYEPDSIARKVLTTVNNIYVNPNFYTIGIELEGKAGQSFTDIQLKVCMQVCKLLKQQYNLKNILTHNETFSLRDCPGNTFPIEQFRKELFPIQ